MRQLSILAETLSAGTPVAQQLVERGVEVGSANLPAGSFQITGSCIVLHLPLADFTRWVAEKTIFRRIIEFKRAVAEPIVIVEGVPGSESRPVSPSALRAALAFISVHNRVPVLFTIDAKESAELLYAMANQVQNGMGITLDAPSSNPEPPKDGKAPAEEGNGNGHGNGEGTTSVEDLIALPEQIVRMIPEVGAMTAKALLRRFGSLRGVFGAGATDLTKIDGIGPKKAKKIAAFLAGRSPRRQPGA